MDLLTKKFESAILFQNASIGDFLMSIFLAELHKKSRYVDHITIVVPRNFNSLKGLLPRVISLSLLERITFYSRQLNH